MIVVYWLLLIAALAGMSLTWQQMKSEKSGDYWMNLGVPVLFVVCVAVAIAVLFIGILGL